MVIGSIPAFVVLFGSFIIALLIDIFISLCVSIVLSFGSSMIAWNVASKGRFLKASHLFLCNFWEGTQKPLTNPEEWIDFPVGYFSLPFVLQLGLLNTLQLSGSANVEATMTWLFLFIFFIVTYMMDVVATIGAVILFLFPICAFSMTVWLTIFGTECSSNGLQNTIEGLADFLKASWDKQEEATNILINAVFSKPSQSKTNQPGNIDDDDASPEMPTNPVGTETSCEV